MKKTVREVVDDAANHTLSIPEFQRDFVWGPRDVMRLAESLYRNYPIGQPLLWETSIYNNPRSRGSKSAGEGQVPSSGARKSLWIVDGQQRITALCLLLGVRPSWWDDKKTWKELDRKCEILFRIIQNENSVQFEFALPTDVLRRGKNWHSLRGFLSGEIKAEDILSRAKSCSERDTVKRELENLLDIKNRIIPFAITKHNLDDVAEVFTRLNQAGKRVKEADVVLALVAVHNPSWIRDEYLPFREQLEQEGWSLDAGVIIRTLTCIGEGKANLSHVRKDFWTKSSMQKYWEETKNIIREVIENLRSFGVYSDRILPSTNSLIPLFTLHQKWRNKRGYNFCKVLHWFLLVNRVGRYSGSAITKINEDVRIIRDSQNFKKVLERLKSQIHWRPLSSEEFLESYNTSRSMFHRLMLWLILQHKNAGDWLSKENIAEIASLEISTLDFHHICPRDVLLRAKIDRDQSDALANITVILSETNKQLSNKLPKEYIRKHSINSQQLKKHCIPDSVKKVGNNNVLIEYEDFLKERAELLAKNANKLLDDLMRRKKCLLANRASAQKSSRGNRTRVNAHRQKDAATASRKRKSTST
ncbi:MAG: DUF262 domain-containing protein [Fimbriimonadales bacterium]